MVDQYTKTLRFLVFCVDSTACLIDAKLTIANPNQAVVNDALTFPKMLLTPCFPTPLSTLNMLLVFSDMVTP